MLITFINMMLFGDNPQAFTCDPYMFPNQQSVQKVLVLAALACIPVMLLGKPIAILLTRRKPKYVRRGKRQRKMFKPAVFKSKVSINFQK